MKNSLNEFDISYVLKELSEKRPLFHNERDLQFELALKIRELYNCDIRLEYYYGNESDGKRCYIDIVAIDRGNNICILFELKYKTKKFSNTLNGEYFSLYQHNARDQGCVYIHSDLQRLENLCINKEKINGLDILKAYVVFITNDKGYQKEFGKNTAFAEFALNNQKCIEGSPRFLNSSTGEKYTKEEIKAGKLSSAKRFDSLNLDYKYTYLIEWKEYSKLTDKAKAYQLVFEIPPKNK